MIGPSKGLDINVFYLYILNWQLCTYFRPCVHTVFILSVTPFTLYYSCHKLWAHLLVFKICFCGFKIMNEWQTVWTRTPRSMGLILVYTFGSKLPVRRFRVNTLYIYICVCVCSHTFWATPALCLNSKKKTKKKKKKKKDWKEKKNMKSQASLRLCLKY